MSQLRTTSAAAQVSASESAAAIRPRLLFFSSPTSGASRRVEGFLAQVLQRRSNHATFELHNLDMEAHSELAQRLGVVQPPTILVVDGGRVQVRVEQPRGAAEIRTALARWLR
jgi:thioredoxin-like negative regulator of GroEL